MTLTPDETRRGGRSPSSGGGAAFAALGHDGARAAALVLDAAGPLEGPVLDLGSGMGGMARELARRGLFVESVDVSADDQEVAAALTAGSGLEAAIRFTPADGAALPFPDGAFASAVSFNVLHHLAEGASVLREVVRVVRPGGVLVLADFSDEGFDIAARVHAAEGGAHPEGPVTLDWARGFLSALGLTETAAGEAHHERFATFSKPAAADAAVPPAFEALDRAGLLKALDVFAKNWLAHDGSWFLAAEERFGMDVAIALDAEAWRRFAAAEARRIMEAYGIPRDGGLDALARALVLPRVQLREPEPRRAGRSGPALLHDVLPGPGDAPAQGPPRLPVPARRRGRVRDVRAHRRPAHHDPVPLLPAGRRRAGALRVGVPARLSGVSSANGADQAPAFQDSGTPSPEQRSLSGSRVTWWMSHRSAISLRIAASMFAASSRLPPPSFT